MTLNFSKVHKAFQRDPGGVHCPLSGVKLFLIIFKKLEILSSGVHCPPTVDETYYLKKKVFKEFTFFRIIFEASYKLGRKQGFEPWYIDPQSIVLPIEL